MLRNRYSKLHRHDTPTENTEPDRLRCSICRFAGVDIETEPGESLTGSTAFVTTGTTYVWTSANDALVTLDKTVAPEPNTSVSCPFCGGERFLNGSKGSGNAVP